MRGEIWTDGAAYKTKGPTTDDPRRGHAGAGYILEGGGARWEVKKPLGLATNNEAEYRAVIHALALAQEVGAEEIHLRLDSDVVYGHVELGKRCRYPHLQELLAELRGQLLGFRRRPTFECVNRDQNTEADLLAKSAKEMSLAGMTDELRSFLDASRNRLGSKE